jgi:signal transduction histidine kinase
VVTDRNTTPTDEEAPYGPALPATALEALDEATRAIASVLDVQDVLQLIADRVRTLIGARYAALGIVSPEGWIEQFITSGISAEQRAAIGAPPTGHGLLGLLILEGRAIRMPRIKDHPASVGFPPNHPPMTSFLGVPVEARGRPIGNFYLTDKDGEAEFTASDQRLAEMFARHAGIAIENARLHAQVRGLAVVQERDRISRDLHDGIIQSLYGVSLSLEDLVDLPEQEVGARVDRAIDALNEAIRDIRHFIHGLSGEATQGRDLAEGLVAVVNETRHNTLAEVEAEIDRAGVPDLPEASVVHLVQLVREALSNAVRHARPSRIVVRLRGTEGGSHVEVVDDGIGFDPATAEGPGHRGLANMRARAAAAGADLWIESRTGTGTRIIVSLPPSPVTGEASS